MTPLELAQRIARPIGALGAGFYFDPGTVEAALGLGLNVYEFYGLGRGGVLGDVGTEAVTDAFYFFHPRTIDLIWSRAREKADPVAVAREHVAAAYAYAERTFGALPRELIDETARCARAVLAADPLGAHPLADGYRCVTAPTDPVQDAYLGVIALRELRGALHIEAVTAEGLSPAEACYLDDPSIFALHGYRDEDVPAVSPELEASKARAEAATDVAMAERLSVLSEGERSVLARGVEAMAAAMANPVPK